MFGACSAVIATHQGTYEKHSGYYKHSINVYYYKNILLLLTVATIKYLEHMAFKNFSLVIFYLFVYLVLGACGVTQKCMHAPALVWAEGSFGDHVGPGMESGCLDLVNFHLPLSSLSQPQGYSKCELMG